MPRSLLIALFLLTTPAHAQMQFDGNFVLQDCGMIVRQLDGADIDTVAMTKGMFCVGYLAGLNDAFRMAPSVSRSKPFYCPPDRGITNEQLVRVVVKFLRENPKELHESARGTVLIALSRAFPCK